jgi:hypothetical protein
MCTIGINIKKFYILSKEFTFIFCMDLRTNSDYFLQTINWFVFMTEKQNVYCAVRTKSWCVILVSPSL